MTDKNKTQSHPKVSHPVVALCGSAGSLKAFQAFFEAMPDNSEMTFIVVQHLADSQESVLHDLLQRHTGMAVEPIVDNTVVKPDHVYVLPAGYFLDLWNGYLRLTPRHDDNTWTHTFDQFLISLAKDQGARVAAVIFSGAGSDGLEGAREVRKGGGVVIAQKLESADHTSMPASIIDAGLADVVLGPADMPDALIAHFAAAADETRPSGFRAVTITEDDMQRVIRRLQRIAGRDFTDYKRSTFARQLRRRMGINDLQSVETYLDYLREHPEEADLLVKYLLINVTSFFRDPEAFEALKSEALLPALRGMDIDTVFRAWVPGCATGQEAVSLAILIHECLEELDMSEMEIQLFATDVSYDVIEQARKCVYPASIVDEISAARLEAHFTQDKKGYRLRNHIKRMITWSVHNLSEHPPFSKQHLISCRNVMIYFQQNLQERLIALFTFALRPLGILFLGMSETVPYTTEAFTVLDSKFKIYQRVEGTSYDWLHLDQPLYMKVPDYTEISMSDTALHRRPPEDRELEIIKNMLVEHYESTCAIVDEYQRMRYTYGEIDRYLKLIPGREGQHNIAKMARHGLDTQLSVALHTCDTDSDTVRQDGIRVRTIDGEEIINLIVKPIQENLLPGAHKLIIFEPAKLDGDELGAEDDEEGASTSQLKRELWQTQQALQNATQALQTKDEELTSSLEEVRSASEEVQTTNEERRTSKEELESLNEELNTLNNQLTDQNYELSRANNTLHNFLQSTEIGMIFLNEDLEIREFTAAVTEIFMLRDVDKERPLDEIVHHLEYDDLLVDAEAVLNTLVTVEKEVNTTAGRWYQLHIRPYRTTTGNIDGLVMTFSDITDRKEAQLEAEQLTAYIRKIFNIVDHCLVELDLDLRILSVNPSFAEKFDIDEENTIGQFLYHLEEGDWDILDLRELLEEIIPESPTVRQRRVSHEFKKRGKRNMQFNACLVGDLNRILLVITEIDEE